MGSTGRSVADGAAGGVAHAMSQALADGSLVDGVIAITVLDALALLVLGALTRARAGGGYFSGIGVARSTATAVTLFCGEPSITRSE